MQLGVSTFLYARGKVVPAVNQLASVGIRYIELTCDYPQSDPLEITEEEKEQLLRLKREKGLVYSLHTPCYESNPASSSRRMRRAVLAGYVDTINLADQLGADQVVVHTGYKSDVTKSKEEARINALETLEGALRFAGNFPGITLVMENTGFHGLNFLDSAQDFSSMVEELNNPQLKLSINVGQAVLQGLDPGQLISQCRQHLVHLHLQDNLGVLDDHLPLGMGNLDYASIVKALKDIHFEGRAIIEIFADNPRPALAQSLLHLRKFGMAE